MYIIYNILEIINYIWYNIKTLLKEVELCQSELIMNCLQSSDLK